MVFTEAVIKAKLFKVRTLKLILFFISLMKNMLPIFLPSKAFKLEDCVGLKSCYYMNIFLKSQTLYVFYALLVFKIIINGAI